MLDKKKAQIPAWPSQAAPIKSARESPMPDPTFASTPDAVPQVRSTRPEMTTLVGR